MLDSFIFSFFFWILLAGLFTAVISGVVGSFIAVKRISFISGSIAHASFGGVGLAYFLGFDPLWGVLIFAFFSAIFIGFISYKNKAQEDSVIGAFWALGMAIGVFFSYLTPGYAGGLLNYLFGNILLVGSIETLILFLIMAGVVSSVVLLYHRFLLITFDEEFAEVSGLNARRYYLGLLILISFSVVALVKSVGIILAVALLTLPAISARLLSQNLKNIIVLSVVFSWLFIWGGVFLSYYFSVPASSFIVFLAGGVYLILWLLYNYKKRKICL